MLKLVEVICTSAADCIAAEAGAADQAELVSAIEMGGLTPTLGALQTAKSGCQIPIMAMVRPRTGGFCYTESEIETMERDVELFRESGADGFVFGILDASRRIDMASCQRLLNRIPPHTESVFHRAFDVTADPFEALETLIDLGFDRILTSGQQPTALEGADLIKRLADKADGRIQILPGSGITLDNYRQVLEATGASMLHMTFFREQPDLSMSQAKLKFNGRGALESSYRCVDIDRVKAAIESISSSQT